MLGIFHDTDQIGKGSTEGENGGEAREAKSISLIHRWERRSKSQTKRPQQHCRVEFSGLKSLEKWSVDEGNFGRVSWGCELNPP